MITYCLAIHPVLGGSDLAYANDAVFVSGTRYEPRLDGQPQWSQWLFGQGKTRTDVVEIPTVRCRLHNADGKLDAVFATPGNFAGAQCYLFAIMEDGSQVVGCSFVADIPTFDTQYITITGKEWISVLDRPFSTHYYAGTNSGSPQAGIEGSGNDIKGQIKPQTWGTCYYVTPVCVNADKLIYQVQDETYGINAAGGIGFMTPYDRLTVLTSGGADYTSQATMEATAPAAGTYRSWPAGGCFRLGSTPVGKLTAIVQSLPSVAGAATYGSRLDAQWIIDELLNHLGYSQLSAVPLKQVTSAGLQATLMNQSVGIYIDSQTTYLQVLSSLAGSVGMGFHTAFANRPTSGAAWVFRRLYGQTTGATGTLSLTADNIVRDTLAPGPTADPEGGAPVVRFSIGYDKFWTSMTKSDAPAASDAFLSAFDAGGSNLAGDGSQLASLPHGAKLTLRTLLGYTGGFSGSQQGAIDLLAYLGGNGASFPGVGVAYDLANHVISLEVPEYTFLNALAHTWSYLPFGPDAIVNVKHSRFGLAAGVDHQLLDFQATGRRTFRLTLRQRRG